MTDDDPGYRAQRAAEAHLAACNEAFWAAEEMAGPGWEDIQSPASAPYDACDTCVVREVLHAAWPIIEAASREVARGADDSGPEATHRRR